MYSYNMSLVLVNMNDSELLVSPWTIWEMAVLDESGCLETADLEKVNGVRESVHRAIGAESKEVSKLVRAENPPLFGVL